MKTSRLPAWLSVLRPRQWTKNLVAYAPLLFAKSAFHDDAALRASAAVLCFLAFASGLYVMNDWVDRERDRLHPEKRTRPIAAGLLSKGVAISLVLGCWVLGTFLALWLGKMFALVAFGYWAVQVLYSFVLKHLVIIDVLTIALGFVLRVLGGAVAISVPISNWLFLCTLLLALFLAFAKRRQELSSLEEDAALHRQALSEYSLPLLDQMISVVAAACILAYGLYTVAPETVSHVGSDALKYTLPCVVYGIFRYLFLIHKKNAGGSPERVLLSDVPLLLDLVLYVALAVVALYGHR